MAMTLTPTERQRRRRHAARQSARREQIRAIAKVATAIRAENTPEAILLAVRRSLRPEAGSEGNEAENVAAGLPGVVASVSDLASHPGTPPAVRLSFVETLLHVAAVAELRAAGREEPQGVRLDSVTLQELLLTNRPRIIAELRRLLCEGIINADDIDPTPASHPAQR
ncbi:hypothetical protein [Planctomicrobium sp. SH664]|uniref:hypothetical protein n=1 Tax=Planctomicrobium sp. SH664 TaxID=3448125 RepID=UPI003F5CB415